jgi:AAA15 family ATPase/GTPase
VLIDFSMGNRLSFKERLDFSMVASSFRQHRARLARLPDSQARVRPIPVILGGNGGGKTNFLLAFDFARRLVLNETPAEAPIAVDPFLLSPENRDAPKLSL